jgi:hypothetical protein
MFPPIGDWTVIKLTVTPEIETTGLSPPHTARRSWVGITKAPLPREREYTIKEVMVYHDTPIFRVSKYDTPCWQKPGFKSLPLKVRNQLQADDEQAVDAFKKFGQVIEAVVTGIVTARQYPSAPFRRRDPTDRKVKKSGLRRFDLSLQEDAYLYEWISHATWWLGDYFSSNNHDIDVLVRLLKESSSEMRVLWQWRENPHPKLNEFSRILVKVINALSETVEHQSEATSVHMDGEVYYLASYPLTVLGYLSRSLPRPSAKKVEADVWDTYERFRDPIRIKEQTVEEIRQWTRDFYKDAPDPSTCKKADPRVGGSLERARSKGGVVNLLSQYYRTVSKSSPDDLREAGLPRTATWRENYKYPPLEAGRINYIHDEHNEFAWNIARDLLDPYITHAHVCKREDCQEPAQHLPMMPFGIGELGGKTRVPCITSGLLNILCTPIRKSMFSIIKKDKRCRFRIKGANNVSMLKGFLQELDESDYVHSGDMTVSTDKFPMKFMETVIQELPYTQEWKDCALLCTGPFFMLSPDDEFTDHSEQRRENAVQPECRNNPLPAAEGNDLLHIHPNEKYLSMLKRIGNPRRDEMFKEANLTRSNPKVSVVFNVKGDTLAEKYDIPQWEGLTYRPDAFDSQKDVKYRDGPAWVYDEFFGRDKDALNEDQLSEFLQKNSSRVSDMTASSGTQLFAFANNTPTGMLPQNYEEQEAWRSNRLDRPIGSNPHDWFYSNAQKTIVDYRVKDSISDFEKHAGIGYDIHDQPVNTDRPAPQRHLLWPTVGGCLDTVPGRESEYKIDGWPYNRESVWLDETQYATWNPQMYETPKDIVREWLYSMQNYTEFGMTTEQLSNGEGSGPAYLTRVGLQMSTACSISMLYSYNLFCDSYANSQPLAKGKSLLCGDDSLRCGNGVYIDAYKRKAEELGSQFSVWKDVTARNSRGMFTELYMQEQEVLQIPKLKTVVRPEGNDESPDWKKFLAAYKTLQAPDAESHQLLIDEAAHKFRNELEDIYNLLPLGLPERLGGMGARGPPLSGRDLRVWNKIKSVRHPYAAFKLTRMFTRCLAPYTIVPKRSTLHLDPFTNAKPIPPGKADEAYVQRKAKWLYLQDRALRGGIEAATSLVQPQAPVEFVNETKYTETRFRTIARGKDAGSFENKTVGIPFSVIEHQYDLDQIESVIDGQSSTSAIFQPTTKGRYPETDDDFLLRTVNSDYATSVVTHILGYQDGLSGL